MKSIILTQPTGVGFSTSSVFYIPLAGGNSFTSESQAKTPVTEAGTWAEVKVRIAATLSQGQYVVTFRKNGVDVPGMSVTFTTSSGQVLTMAGTISGTIGDFFDFAVTPSGTPTAAGNIQIGATYDTGPGGAGVMFCGFAVRNFTNYSAPTMQLDGASTEPGISCPVPVGMSVSKLWVNLSAAPGAGTSRAITVRRNATDTGLTATFSNSEVGLKPIDLSGSPVAFTAGTDLISVANVATGAVANAAVNIGLSFIPVISGASPQFFTHGPSGVSASITYYQPLAGPGANTTEASVYSLLPCDATLSNLYAHLDASPGGGTRTFTPRKNGTDQSAMGFGITGSNLDGNSAATSFSAVAGDLLTVREVPTTSPAGARISCGIVIIAAGGGAAAALTGTGGPAMCGFG